MMPKLTVFNSVTLDGYFTGANNDLSWAHTRSQDPEWLEFTSQNAKGGGTLVFGRKTYDMMVGFWPTEQAKQQMPDVAAGMNSMSKVVFSKKLDKSDWNNTRVVHDDPATEIRKLKKSSGEDMVVLGSGTIVSQLTQAGLVDEYQIVVVPVVIGKGRTMFEGVHEPLNLKPTRTRSFQNGRVLMCYEPR